ncbi:MAG: addiction module protein [Rhodocyclaceae bacterium]|nr:addiction module protein [Rhodocyclaceae bacterium]
MVTTIEALESEVLNLPASQQSLLLERLMTGLNANPDITEAWEREAIRRNSEVDCGIVCLVPGIEVIER